MPPVASSSAAPKVRTRSKNACHTCKLRRKKCPEVYNAQGVCERCEQAGLPCTADAPDSAIASLGGARPKKSVSTSTAPLAVRPAPIEPARRALAPQPSSSRARLASRPPSTSTASRNTPPSVPPVAVTSSAPQPFATAPSASAPTYASPIAPLPLPTFPPPIPPQPYHSATTSSFNAYIPHNVHLPPAPNMTAPPETLFDLPQSDQLLAFFDSLTPAIDLNNFDQLVSTSTGSAWSSTFASTPAPQAAPSPAMGGVLTDWRAMSSPAESVRTPRDDDRDVAIPVYEALSDAWMSAMPKPVREMIKKQITDTAFSSHLGQSASIALCLMYRARMLDKDASDDTRQRLIQQSDAYFQDAVNHLDAAIPLEAQCLAVFDMTLHQLEQYGPGPAYAVFQIADYFVHQSLGPNPVLDLETPLTSLDFMLQGIAMSNVLRNVFCPDSRSLFRYVGDPVNPPPRPAQQVDELGLPHDFAQSVWGMPIEMILCLAATSDLAVDEPSLSREEVQRRVNLIENKIKTWQPPALAAQALTENAILAMENLVTGEMWRQASLIFLYQAVLHLGPLAPRIRHALAQLIALGSRVTPPLLPPQSPPTSPLPTACPATERVCCWAIAATACINEDDRTLCREGIRRAVTDRLAKENLKALERLWQIADDTVTIPQPENQGGGAGGVAPLPDASAFGQAVVATAVPQPSAAASVTKSETDTVVNEKIAATPAKEKEEGASSPHLAIEPTEDVELEGLPEEYRRIIAEQLYEAPRKPVGFFELFRFATKGEIALNLLGVLAAIIAGIAEPMMAVVMGGLTNAFTTFAQAQASASEANGAEVLDAARDALLKELTKDVLYLIYIGIGEFVSTYVYMATWIYTGEVATRRLREAYLTALLRQNTAYHDKIGAGEFTSRIEGDTHYVQEAVSDKIPISVKHLSTFVSGFVVAVVVNWRLGLILSSIIPALFITGAFMDVYMAKFKEQSLKETAEGATLVEEVVSSVRNTHAFGTQGRLVALYDIRNLAACKFGMLSAKANAAGMIVFFFVLYSSYALAFFQGTRYILSGQATPGNVLVVIFSIMSGAMGLVVIAPNLMAVAHGQSAATSIYKTIDRKPKIDSASPDGLKPETVQGDIEFTDVDFIYPARPKTQVLYGFSGSIPSGKMTALVGGSGSGKSTIVSLVERFYDPVGGSIKLDGVELKDLNVGWLRSQIGLVSQEPTLFATTVAGNIEHGLIGSRFENESPEERRARVVAAAKEANAHDFVMKLPEAYETMIGERGMLLSGGQKQRIAIARAIIGDPRILLLDEATSALDTSAEVLVQEALDRAAAGRTTIAIAHRLSTIKNADQIIVLTAGRILESAMSSDEGSAHDTLLRKPEGAYYALVNAQKFREAAEADTQDKEAPSFVGKVPVEDEKPRFEPVGRTMTGRSAASDAMAEGVDGDLETGNNGKKYSSFYLLKRMFRLNSDHWVEYCIATAASVLVGVVYPVMSIVFGGILGAYTLPLDSEENRAQVQSSGNRFALYAFIIALVASAGTFVDSYLWWTTSEHLSTKLRRSTFAAMLRQDIMFFDTHSSGALTSDVADLAQKVSGLAGITAGVIIQNIFTLIGGFIVGLVYSWRIALLAIACTPFTIAAGLVRLKIVTEKDEKTKAAHQTSASFACESAAAIRTVASLTREADCVRIYSQHLDGPMRISNRIAFLSNAFYSATQGVTFLVIATIFYVGGRELSLGRLSTGDFFVALMAIVFGSIQVGEVYNWVPNMSKSKAAAEDYVKLVDSEPSIDAEDPSGATLTTTDGHLRFNNIRFRYPSRPHVRVLRGLDLEVLPGQFVAICGPSGGGKSTIIQLVERFYDPLAGTITVDGHDISELNLKSYREKISLVSQEPTLYAGSVRFNITLGANKPPEQVTEAEIEQACRDANIHDFVMSLPDGYNTDVGGKGTQLSGGQKQRIAIARALIRNPRILLLDEATSALDGQSEIVVQAALDQAAKGRSTIAVAHRLSTIQHADVIYVLGEGRVAEQGTHAELMARQGVYFELVQQQSLEKTR